MSEFHESGRGGQIHLAEEAYVGVSSAPRAESEAAGHNIIAAEAKPLVPAASPHAETLEAIRWLDRERGFAMAQRIRMTNALAAHLRMQLGWHAGLSAAEGGPLKTRALQLVAEGEKLVKSLNKARAAGLSDEPDPDALDGFAEIVVATLRARQPFEAMERRLARLMAAEVKTLPVWRDFAAGVRGLGAVSLAVILSETGDLAAYPKKGHVWKRLGLAVMDGVRQGGLAKGASKADWIAHGYKPHRRARIFVIGNNLLKQGGEYRAVYQARKDYERARAEERGLTVAPSDKIPAARRAEFVSDGHIHKRAKRYMEKRLVRDLWQAWNGRSGANERMPERLNCYCPASATPGAARKRDCASALSGRPAGATGRAAAGTSREAKR